ncbi:lipid A export permease/ATP-binding protein MsbA [Chitinolyticbacter meiyuanensis]|uniref:lipid A export permease/ATP-binding protein MsbA n=1 Tax=Chitinolyticbacter meiyuanensis TaxID=682798 RepID=UPI0011E5CDE7|nr:lipid A export permease/ATP-binding protein MsbA [Chitinolyticbacter meiyuanensis]
MTNRQLYFRILGHIKPYKWVIVVNMICLALAAAVDAAMIGLLQPIVDKNLNAAGNMANAATWVIPAQIVGLAVLRMISNYGNEYLGNWVTTRVVADLRSRMFERMIQLPVRVFDQNAVGVLLSRVTYDVNQIMLAGIQILTTLVRDSMMVVYLVGLMLWHDWRLTLLCIVLIPGVAVSIRVVGKRQRRLARESQQKVGQMTRTLDEAFSGQRVVKIFNGQTYEQQRFDHINNQVRLVNVKQTATSSANSSLIMLLIGITLAIIIYFASLLVQHGALTAGAFVSFVGAMLLVQQPVKSLTKLNEQFHKGLAAAESVFGVLDEEIERDTGTKPLARAQGALSLQQVEFRYEHAEKLALNGISVEVAPGETVALVGSSGSGKTTLANLIPRFYDHTGGRILLDGVPLADYRLRDLRAQIALVSQDVVLFDDTVTANIAYGDPRPDPERLRAAAQAAFALDFIEALPDGFATPLGENGSRLSGGQRQRIAIARALYKDAPILILDEATSALDTESERQVQAALENLMRSRTTLVIAHRLSTIENADRILVLRDGKVAEEGRHAELLARNGLYAQMHAAQFSEG